MIVGNPSSIAIESSVTEAYEFLGARALGFFVIHVRSNIYGVRAPDATLLACSLDAVKRRIARRGMHRVPFGSETNAVKLVDAFCAAEYDEGRQLEEFFDMSCDEFRETLHSSEIVWAPDGDEAFDDGSHVLQFDQGDNVRIVAFKNTRNPEDIAGTIAETYVSADAFYAILKEWQSRFEGEWAAAVKTDLNQNED